LTFLFLPSTCSNFFFCAPTLFRFPSLHGRLTDSRPETSNEQRSGALGRSYALAQPMQVRVRGGIGIFTRSSIEQTLRNFFRRGHATRTCGLSSVWRSLGVSHICCWSYLHGSRALHDFVPPPPKQAAVAEESHTDHPKPNADHSQDERPAPAHIRTK
jgi:hypothetical protein